jgi:hypothetical protein
MYKKWGKNYREKLEKFSMPKKFKKVLKNI